MFYTVALLSPPYHSLTYTKPSYLSRKAWSIGTRVIIPLGKSMVRVGLILAEEPENRLSPDVLVRDMLWPIDSKPLCSVAYLEFITQLATRQMLAVGRILATALPLGLRDGKRTMQVHNQNSRPLLFKPRDLLLLPKHELDALALLWAEGKARWIISKQSSAENELCVLSQQPPWAVRPGAKKQLAVLELLWEKGVLSRREVLQKLGNTSRSALDALIRNATIHIRLADSHADLSECETALLPPPSPAVVLNHAQQEAVTRYTAHIDSQKAATGLLFGITGSGKTAVYLALIEACLHRGRSVLLLAPEVALVHKLTRDLQMSLGNRVDVIVSHGYQTSSLREQHFLEARSQAKACIVVGTRSALFLPLENIGLIILDEEHDASFKQDEGLMYQAKELAWFRAEQDQALLLLGSATPDIKTFKAAQDGHIILSALPERVGLGRLPEIELVDICKTTHSESLLAPSSLKALQETIEAGQQAVILLNRRGYAPLMYCLDCGKSARCPHCDIALTYHKGRERLVCHYCGYTLPFPATCSFCKGLHYHPMGQGTERLEETLRSVLPQKTHILRIDRDSTRCPGRMESILESFAAQEAQVLVGTQMLSKGHHFPNVTLALIADGDMGLNIPDYRAAERTFQLLVQSAGRAGRGEQRGRVLIQTRTMEHYCWKFVQQNDYEGFYATELALRKKYSYPPFTRLGLLRMSYPVDYQEGEALMKSLAETIRQYGRNYAVTVRGPAPAPLSLIRGRRRFHCLLKGKDWLAIRTVAASLGTLKIPRDVRVSLDMDPINML